MHGLQTLLVLLLIFMMHRMVDIMFLNRAYWEEIAPGGYLIFAITLITSIIIGTTAGVVGIWVRWKYAVDIALVFSICCLLLYSLVMVLYVYLNYTTVILITSGIISGLLLYIIKLFLIRRKWRIYSR